MPQVPSLPASRRHGARVGDVRLGHTPQGVPQRAGGFCPHAFLVRRQPQVHALAELRNVGQQVRTAPTHDATQQAKVPAATKHVEITKLKTARRVEGCGGPTTTTTTTPEELRTT